MTPRISPTDHRAVVFDLDGVVTDTAAVHAAAWKQLFDEYLANRNDRDDENHGPFSAEDYRRYVDGKPRYDGVESFLRSRGIELRRGDADDGPDEETVCGLGNRKNRYFGERLERDGVRVFGDAVGLVHRLHDAGVATAVISASRNCRRVLERAGLEGLFEVRVDGVVADELDLPGKPDPAVLVEAARRLDVAPSRAVVVEDARAGVEAGRRGGFALVVGVDRDGGRAESLAECGADVVVGALDVIVVEAGEARAARGAADPRSDRPGEE